MTVFRATYSDLKLIKTRGVVQFCFEVPLEHSAEAMRVLGGMPTPASEVWCAIARLGIDAPNGKEDDSKTEIQPSAQPPLPASNEPPARADTRLAQKAGKLCNDPRFWKFCQEDGCIIHDKDQAAEHVRAVCEVQTRRDIRPGTVAEQRLNLIISAFEAWKLGPQCGAA